MLENLSKRNLVIAAIGLLILLAVVLGFRPQAKLADIVEVVAAPMTVTVEEEGRTRVIDRFELAAPVSGFLQRLKFDVGDAIEQGQNLASLEPLRSNVLDPRSRAEAQARVAAANAALAASKQQVLASKADSEFAQSEYQKKKRLKEKNYVSEDELIQARTAAQRASANLRSAKFAVDVAQHDLDAARTSLQFSGAGNSSSDSGSGEQVAIQSPINGAVLKIIKKSEGVVNAGTLLIEVGDPASLEIEVDVLSFDAVRIKPGTRVKIKRWGGAELDGQVRVVEPVGVTKVSALGVEEQRVWVIVDITSPPELWASLGDGYRVEAEFVLWQEASVLQVPNASLFRQDGDWALFVVDAGKASIRSVEVGRRNGLQAQILSGVNEGDEVISFPDNELRDGDRVKAGD